MTEPTNALVVDRVITLSDANGVMVFQASTNWRAALGTLSKKIDAISAKTEDWIYYSQKQRTAILRALAEASDGLLAELVHILQDSPEDKLIDTAFKIDQFKATLWHATELVTAPFCEVPWEFLFVGDNCKEPHIEDFLGFRLSVRRSLQIASHNIRTDSTAVSGTIEQSLEDYLSDSLFPEQRLTRESTKAAEIILIEDDNLKSASNGLERKLIEACGIKCHTTPPISMRSPNRFAAIRASIESASGIIHFNCHGNRARPEGPDQAEVRVSNNCPVPASEFKSVRPRPNSIVVLSVCHSGQLDAFMRRSLTFGFANSHVSTVVSAANEIFDVFASRWASRFYSELVSGKSVGEALLSVRHRARTDEMGNPAVLFFISFGRNDAKLRPLMKKVS